MEIEDLRNYGAAFSEAEGSWPDDVKARMQSDAKAVIMRHLSGWQKVRLMWHFIKARRQAAKLDLSDLRERGMTDEAFLDQQLEYLAMFSALAQLFDAERAVVIMKEVMDESAREPLLHCLPEPEHVRQVDAEPFDVFRDYNDAMAKSSVEAGCNMMAVEDDGDDAFQLNVTWCVWLELAERMGVPEACKPNCYADDLVFPEYFDALGIRYSRSQTLACGGTCCDFRFERK
ncbi:hypothetical protein FIV42_22615 [Persicimonas caeni]|uniref:L-2-amino-thiazoline-4-carboxylic acid hydrolase n=1 Tax=Persicimonas caeni TaxID=2292766 RepID=A0A4Y6PYM2_PERCE|nr:L-2-amino-thiazoline-4-carboxylic acid hydrolase [Persicimonas caeni]QDG53434.1 hypothetical protein FIV42_22615 [Persicimonas caeni]QED34655.1 hypothetical protein FRD00_22610 [Persicimonas caeni]